MLVMEGIILNFPEQHPYLTNQEITKVTSNARLAKLGKALQLHQPHKGPLGKVLADQVEMLAASMLQHGYFDSLRQMLSGQFFRENEINMIRHGLPIELCRSTLPPRVAQALAGERLSAQLKEMGKVVLEAAVLLSALRQGLPENTSADFLTRTRKQFHGFLSNKPRHSDWSSGLLSSIPLRESLTELATDESLATIGDTALHQGALMALKDLSREQAVRQLSFALRSEVLLSNLSPPPDTSFTRPRGGRAFSTKHRQRHHTSVATTCGRRG